MELKALSLIISVVVALGTAGATTAYFKFNQDALAAGQTKNSIEIQIIKKEKECDEAESTHVEYERKLREDPESQFFQEHKSKWLSKWEDCKDELKDLKARM